MRGKLPNQNQRNLFRPILKEIVNPEHELVILAHRIEWNEIEDDFSPRSRAIASRGICKFCAE